MTIKMRLNEIKTFAPQVIAVLCVTSSFMLVGICSSFSGILIPQIYEGVGGIKLSKSESTWIVSCVTLVPAVVNLFGGILTDCLGRLNVLRLAALPNIIGWTVIALSSNGTMLLIGRIFTGIGFAFGSTPCIVYVSEISSPNVRGAFLAFPPICFAIGVLSTYLAGYFIYWDWYAWVVDVCVVLNLILLSLIPESPQWLISRNCIPNAKLSLQWFQKYEITDKKNDLDNQISCIKTEQEKSKQMCAGVGRLNMFLQPIGYKPLIILTLLFLIQQFSATHIVIMNAVTFFNAIGSEFDPYLASTYMAAMRLVMSVLFVWAMKKISRRVNLIISCCGMSLSMTICGLYTKWVQEGTTLHTWVPLCMLILYFIFMAGLFSVPFALTGELFPLAIRGIATNIVFAITNFSIFTALQSYPVLERLLGGISGLQYFFGGCAFIGLIFTVLFVPETQNKKLADIEEYFWTRTTYIDCHIRRKNNVKCDNN